MRGLEPEVVVGLVAAVAVAVVVVVVAGSVEVASVVAVEEAQPIPWPRSSSTDSASWFPSS